MSKKVYAVCLNNDHHQGNASSDPVQAIFSTERKAQMCADKWNGTREFGDTFRFYVVEWKVHTSLDDV